MNKYNRDKHITSLQLIEKAAFAIPELIRIGRESEVPQVLADCQDVAVALGGHIEKLYGLRTKTVSALEEYCEALYVLSAELNEASLINLAETIEKLQITYDIEFPEKKEVVFMPYNASMWDSLESVWMAARDDENCEVYVVPIPYYGKDSNGSMSKFYYEGDSFPEYVPITHYQDYDLSLRHPDVVYIHNPYDDYNYVTSVHPDYYSRELKKYTNKLVYIPYFVIDESRNMDKVEHFACQPAVFFADYVIVQSEEVKARYVDALTKNVKEISRCEWNNRILSLGSPKFDAVYKYTKTSTDIPKEWQEMIGDKKVVLYNTHLALLMKEKSEDFLKKLRSVIELFKAKDGVVLLWRPHPLMVQTAMSMNPEVVDEYMSIVNEFRENKYGIYDDSSDMTRAVAISDAYYGSPSSVLVLYKSTGKPVLIHNIKVDTIM